MTKMKQVTSGGQIYICRLRDRLSPPLSLSTTRRSNVLRQIKLQRGKGGGRGRDQTNTPPSFTGKNGEIFPMITLIPRLFSLLPPQRNQIG